MLSVIFITEIYFHLRVQVQFRTICCHKLQVLSDDVASTQQPVAEMFYKQVQINQPSIYFLYYYGPKATSLAHVMSRKEIKNMLTDFLVVLNDKLAVKQYLQTKLCGSFTDTFTINCT